MVESKIDYRYKVAALTRASSPPSVSAPADSPVTSTAVLNAMRPASQTILMIFLCL
jgi:hypothetical protein